MVAGARYLLLQRQPVKARDIEDMRRRPAVQPVPHIGRDALLTRHLDQWRDQPLPDRVMHLGKPHHRNIDAGRQQRGAGDLGGFAGVWMVRIEHVLPRKFAGSGRAHAGARGDDQRARRSGKPGAQGLDRAPVLVAIRHEVREVVVEGAVDHAFCLCRAAAQTLGILERSKMRLGAGGDERLGTRPPLGSGRAPHALPRAAQSRSANR